MRTLQELIEHYGSVSDLPAESDPRHAKGVLDATLYLMAQELTAEIDAQAVEIATLRAARKSSGPTWTEMAMKIDMGHVNGTNGHGAPVDAEPVDAEPEEMPPFRFQWPTLDDTSLALARALDAGETTWRSLSRDDRRVIALAAVKEMATAGEVDDLPTIGQFDSVRPAWMPRLATLTVTLGMTWTQMLKRAAEPF